ncbi:hypothetical protein NDU88_005149, partial [Pleurodeles waltl]
MYSAREAPRPGPSLQPGYVRPKTRPGHQGRKGSHARPPPQGPSRSLRKPSAACGVREAQGCVSYLLIWLHSL